MARKFDPMIVSWRFFKGAILNTWISYVQCRNCGAYEYGHEKVGDLCGCGRYGFEKKAFLKNGEIEVPKTKIGPLVLSYKKVISYKTALMDKSGVYDIKEYWT